MFALGVGALAVLLGLAVGAFALFGDGNDATDDEAVAAPGVLQASGVEDPVVEIKLLLQGIGYQDIEIVEDDGTIFVSGEVASQADRAAVVTAAVSQADDFALNTDGLSVSATAADAETAAQPLAVAGQVDPLQQLQVLLDRTVAIAPVIFPPAQTDLDSWHLRTLDQVAQVLLNNPGIAINIVGYTDDSGSAASNAAISLSRASAVRQYLISRSVVEGLLGVEARGESQASGVRDIGYLERRVEFEVVAAADAEPVPPRPLDIGVVIPSASDDFAFSQSMVDALDVLSAERGGLSLTINDGIFDPDEAGVLARGYVDQGAEVVILHGDEFIPLIQDLATANPDVIFVVGPGEFETDLPNVFLYTVAAEQGAYVLGDLAAKLSESKTLGIVGPLEVPEPRRYVEGFRLGAEAQGAEVLVEYAGSFNDVETATQIAEAHHAAGADVLTGTAELVVGPIAVAKEKDTYWFANQSNQNTLAPERVVASQVYHFEVAIRQILAEIDSGATTGGTFPLTLGNGGVLLEFNPEVPIDQELRQEADDLLFAVTSGQLDVGYVN